MMFSKGWGESYRFWRGFGKSSIVVIYAVYEGIEIGEEVEGLGLGFFTSFYGWEYVSCFFCDFSRIFIIGVFFFKG